MASYGELLDSNLNLDSLATYTFFSEYFGNPRMSLIREEGNNVIYCCRIKCGLTRQKRYILAIVPKERFFTYEKVVNLVDLSWTMLQTRTLEEDKVVPVHTYVSKEDNENFIKLIQKDDQRYTYSCSSFPIKISLLTTKTQTQPYSSSGTVGLALETYNCVVYLTTAAKA